MSASSARAWARRASRRWRSAASSRLASKSVVGIDDDEVVGSARGARAILLQVVLVLLLLLRVPVLVAAFRRERLRSGGRCSAKIFLHKRTGRKTKKERDWSERGEGRSELVFSSFFFFSFPASWTSQPGKEPSTQKTARPASIKSAGYLPLASQHRDRL